MIKITKSKTKMESKTIFSILILLAIFLSACSQSIQQKIPDTKAVNSFEECVNAGYPVGESYPRQCFALDGKRYIEQIDKEIEKTIETEKGELKLAYKDTKAILTGTLSRSTPCVNWTVQIGGTRDLPRSQVTINIFDKNKVVMCIQILGEPQEIYEEIIDVSEETEYAMKLEQEVIFSGTINSLDTRDGLIVEIPSTFLLSEGQTAKITNHEDEEITLTEIGTDSIKLTIYFPGGCGPNSDPPNSDPRCLGPPSFQKEYDLKVGEIIDVMGITIKVQYISKNFANLSIKLQN